MSAGFNQIRSELDYANKRIAELEAENASLRTELAQAKAETQLVAAQGVAALADLRAEHERELAEAADAVGVVQDNVSKLQQAARGVL